MSERYRIIELLGQGAMGEVHRAEDVHLQREVALKRLALNLRADDRATRRFGNEARVTAGLEHPGIVPVHAFEVGPSGDVGYAMKLVRGRTLADFIAEVRAQPERAELSLKARLEVFLHVLDAMAYAHERGVLHRDLKPENIMVGAFGEVLVMDWGLARPVGRRLATLPEDESLAGHIIGTPAFMSPEQAEGLTEQLTPASDQFALGMLLFELVTLSEARTARSLEEAIRAALSGRRNAIVHRDPKVKVPRELAAIITKATAYRPDARYPSVTAMADDVRRFLRDEPVVAAPDSAWRKVERWVGHHRKGVLLGAVIAAAVVVALVAVMAWRSAVSAREQDLAAEAREDALQKTAALVYAQSNLMNERLHAFDGLLQAFTAAAARVMSEPPPDPAREPSARVTFYHYFADGHHEPAPEPPTRYSPIYHAPMSFTEPDYALAPGVDSAAMAARGAQLSRLAPVLRRTQLESGGLDAPANGTPNGSANGNVEVTDPLELSAADAEKLGLDVGLPLVWVYLATEDGAAVGFPGSWEYTTQPGETGYDPRKHRWYLEAPRDGSSKWLNSGVDENGLGVLVTDVRAITDDRRQLLGVAAIDLTVDYVISRLLEHPRLVAAGAEAVVIDAGGKVVVRSSDRGKARDATTYTPADFEHTSILDARVKRPSGHATLPDGRLAFWAPVRAAGWTYIVIGPEAALLNP